MENMASAMEIVIRCREKLNAMNADKALFPVAASERTIAVIRHGGAVLLQLKANVTLIRRVMKSAVI